jgi:hypothetical protein
MLGDGKVTVVSATEGGEDAMMKGPHTCAEPEAMKGTLSIASEADGDSEAATLLPRSLLTFAAGVAKHFTACNNSVNHVVSLARW